jgi:hypothetical protein
MSRHFAPTPENGWPPSQTQVPRTVLAREQAASGDVRDLGESERTFANYLARGYHEFRAALKADFMTQ